MIDCRWPVALCARNAADEKWVDAEELGADTKKKGRGDFLYEVFF